MIASQKIIREPVVQIRNLRRVPIYQLRQITQQFTRHYIHVDDSDQLMHLNRINPPIIEGLYPSFSIGPSEDGLDLKLEV